jgi:ribosomal protein L13E
MVEQHCHVSPTANLNSISARLVDLPSGNLRGFAISRLEKAGLKRRLTRKLTQP